MGNIQNIPLKKETFKLLTYSGIPVHELTNTESGLKVDVKKSAAPIIYKLPQAHVLSEIHFQLKILGQLKLKKEQQGEKGNDDFRFRFGVVYEGDNTINAFQRMLAPGWLKELFKLGENYKGVDRIQFHTTYQDTRIADKSRDHYFSEYLKEIHEIKIGPEGMVNHKITPETNRRVLGFWIAIDGDDTDSEFQVEMNKLSYQIKNP